MARNPSLQDTTVTSLPSVQSMPLRLSALLLAVVFGAARLSAQPSAGEPPRDTTRKMLVVPGQRAGTSVFPLTNYAETKPLVPGQIDWKHYHTSAEIEEFMQKWAK